MLLVNFLIDDVLNNANTSYNSSNSSNSYVAAKSLKGKLRSASRDDVSHPKSRSTVL